MSDTRELHAKMKRATENLVHLKLVFFGDVTVQKEEDWDMGGSKVDLAHHVDKG